MRMLRAQATPTDLRHDHQHRSTVSELKEGSIRSSESSTCIQGAEYGCESYIDYFAVEAVSPRFFWADQPIIRICLRA